jgi:hypothetical protein
MKVEIHKDEPRENGDRRKCLEGGPLPTSRPLLKTPVDGFLHRTVIECPNLTTAERRPLE